MKFIIDTLLLAIALMTLLMVLFFAARGCESVGGSVWNAVKDVEIPRTSWIAVDGDDDSDYDAKETSAFDRGWRDAERDWRAGTPFKSLFNNGD